MDPPLVNRRPYWVDLDLHSRRCHLWFTPSRTFSFYFHRTKSKQEGLAVAAAPSVLPSLAYLLVPVSGTAFELLR